ncbi:MAG: hypothetical protein ACE5RR_04790 [Nitrosarchaeum sp.]
MYSASTDKQAPPPDTGKFVRLIIVAIIAVAIFAIAGNQAVILSMNFTEFGEQFSKPLYYSLISTVILSAIALVRVNIIGRSSIFWYGIHTAIGLIGKSTPQSISTNIPNFRDFKLSPLQFVIWQITKILLFGAFFVNVMFGFAAVSFIDGNNLGLENLSNLFSLPFVTPTDPNYSLEKVIPMIPSLVLLLPPILAAIGLRLVLYVGIHKILNVITSYFQDSKSGKPRYLNYVSSIETVIAVGILWFGFNLFFTDQIDYNTRYIVGGTLLIGFTLLAFSLVDRIRARVLTHMFKRDVYIRFLTVLAIAVIVGGLATVNNSIADAKKIEYLGPYTAQQISVNRYIGQLNDISENTHDVKLQSVSPNNIKNYVNQNRDVLNVVRVWDWQAAFAKL